MSSALSTETVDQFNINHSHRITEWLRLGGTSGVHSKEEKYCKTGQVSPFLLLPCD